MLRYNNNEVAFDPEETEAVFLFLSVLERGIRLADDPEDFVDPYQMTIVEAVEYIETVNENLSGEFLDFLLMELRPDC